jgi:hypothetical protein
MMLISTHSTQCNSESQSLQIEVLVIQYVPVTTKHQPTKTSPNPVHTYTSWSMALVVLIQHSVTRHLFGAGIGQCLCNSFACGLNCLLFIT